MEIGQRIGDLRHKFKLSQRELGSAIGVTGQHISAIEQNKRTVSLDLLVRMANELGTTCDYILTGKQGLSDAAAAIRADRRLNLRVKRAFIVLLGEINQNNGRKEGNGHRL